jgi:hypothetical protein
MCIRDRAIDSLKRARKLNPQNEVIAEALANAKEKARQNGAWPPAKKDS